MRQAKFPKALTIALSSEVYDVLKDVSDSERVSMAELVREILSNVTLPLCGSENVKADNSVSATKGEDDNDEQLQ
jgi:hypothetical protein